MNKTVFAVPGNIDDGLSIGTNELIRDGAFPLLSAMDVIDELIERKPDFFVREKEEKPKIEIPPYEKPTKKMKTNNYKIFIGTLLMFICLSSNAQTDKKLIRHGNTDFKNGKYTVRLDLNTMKVTLTLTEADPVIESQYPTTLYVCGGFNGWALEQLDKIADGKFQKENVQMNLDNGPDDPKGHGIKFFENADWSGQWGPKEDWEHTDYRGWELASYPDAPQFYPQLAGYTSGKYTVLVDFTTMTLTLTPAWQAETEVGTVVISCASGEQLIF